MSDPHDIKGYNKGTQAELEALCVAGNATLNIPPAGKVNFRDGQLAPNSEHTMSCISIIQNPTVGKELEYLAAMGSLLSAELVQLTYNEAQSEGWFPPIPEPPGWPQ